MATKLTFRRVDGELVVTFPAELAKRMQVDHGDEIHAIETERGLLLTGGDVDFERAMEAFAAGRRKYENALRKLAE